MLTKKLRGICHEIKNHLSIINLYSTITQKRIEKADCDEETEKSLNTAIKNIHLRNTERLDKFSTQLKVSQVEGTRTVIRDVIVYNFKGLLEICRYSNQPKANAVMDRLWEIADEIRKTGNYSIYKDNPALPSGVLEGARLIFETAGIKDNQLTLAMDKVYKSYTGRSALAAGEIQLEAPTKRQLLTPTEIGRQFGLKARQINDILAGRGYQYKVNDNWEPLKPGIKYAVMIDTNKRHSDGTPVRQLKWDSSILEPLRRIIDSAYD